jgi:hypothetical protein
MKLPESAATFPPSYSIDYDSVLGIAVVEGGANIQLFLRQYFTPEVARSLRGRRCTPNQYGASSLWLF